MSRPETAELHLSQAGPPDDDLVHVACDDEGLTALCGKYIGEEPWVAEDSAVTCLPCAVLDGGGVRRGVRMTAVDQVELQATVEVRCNATPCGFWQQHDRAAGDQENPDWAARRHVADTGHTVTVTSVHRTVAEYRTSDVFGADADTSQETAA